MLIPLQVVALALRVRIEEFKLKPVFHFLAAKSVSFEVLSFLLLDLNGQAEKRVLLLLRLGLIFVELLFLAWDIFLFVLAWSVEFQQFLVTGVVFIFVQFICADEN